MVSRVSSTPHKSTKSGFTYNLEPYDELRMKLLERYQWFYIEYERTVKDLEEKKRLHPDQVSFKSMPSILLLLFLFVVVFICVVYIAVVVFFLSFWNIILLVLLGILIPKLGKGIKYTVDTCFNKCKMEDFKKFVKRKNVNVFRKMGVEMTIDEEDGTLRFMLTHD